MFKGLDFILRTNGTHLRLLAMAESEQAPICSFGLTKTLNFMLFYANYLFIRKLFVSLPTELINCYGL